ncbi:hypothetical protein G6011_01001 [Alternaria panax]|uniref:Uncharacterized protein n=1 Tax=Alternaria panax TaxID=48097 RepID=A0AAD4NW64_9PLEO|nr:hypothetical protein G6011_01001 [Alternaria panax]
MITILGLWTLLIVGVASAPLSIDAHNPAHEMPIVYGEPPGPRYRVRMLSRQAHSRITLTQVYFFILYFLSMGFVFAAAVVNNGLGLATHGTCRIAMRICIVFYAGSKVSMYLFLVERAHALRAPYMSRYHDLLWLLSTIGIVSSLGAVGIVAFVLPVFWMSDTDGRCRIGVKRYTGVPLLTCDIVINIYLTLVFVYLLSPLVRGSQSSSPSFANRLALCIGNTCGRAKCKATVDLRRSNQVMAKKVETLLWKTFIGSVLVIVPTAANLTSLCILQGHELAFICLTICTFDVTWAAVVLHWLTMAGTDEKEEARVKPSIFQPCSRPAPPLPMRKKSSILSATDLEIISIDADEDNEQKASSGPSFSKDDKLSAKKHSTSERSEAHWRDSGHFTLVSSADANMSSKTVNPD